MKTPLTYHKKQTRPTRANAEVSAEPIRLLKMRSLLTSFTRQQKMRCVRKTLTKQKQERIIGTNQFRLFQANQMPIFGMLKKYNDFMFQFFLIYFMYFCILYHMMIFSPDFICIKLGTISITHI